MRYRMLGNTGVYVSELCLATMTFGGKGFTSEQIKALDAASELPSEYPGWMLSWQNRERRPPMR